MKNAKFETLVLHGGHEPDCETGSRAVPLYRTSSYMFKNAKHAADLFSLQEEGYIYTRLGGPTQEVLEKRMALLEGGKAALALSSGTSAIYYSIINICRAGDEIVTASNLYGGTYTMFSSILPQFGITVRFVPPADLDAFSAAVNEKTKAVYVETLGNPSLEAADLEKIAEIAHKAEVPFIVDSTFTTPYLLRPLEHGADIVVHSLTKWLGGHGTAIGGIVVDGGTFPWDNGKFPLYTEPDESYHGIRWGKDLGENNPLAFILRMRTVPLRNLGACISPDNAWLFLQGIETLPLRMERHCSNAAAVAEFLEDHPAVEWVRYPGLPKDPSHETAKRYLKRGFGGMVVFGVKGGRAGGEKLVDSLSLFSHLANVGDAKSLAIHPAGTTHAQLSEEQQREAGLCPEMVRLSVGLEHIDDILEDLKQGLSKMP